MDFSHSSSLGNRIFTILEKKILNGELKVNDSLVEGKVSEELGVSRTPVREALKQLESAGLVTIIPNKGAIVRGMSDDDIRDIYEIRMRLESLAAKWAAQKANPEDIKKLSECVDLIEFYYNKNNTEQIRNLDSQFHNIIYDACNSRMLKDLLVPLMNYIKSTKERTLYNDEIVISVHNEHKEIYLAIKNKDEELAGTLAANHVKNALNRLFE